MLALTSKVPSGKKDCFYSGISANVTLSEIAFFFKNLDNLNHIALHKYAFENNIAYAYAYL